MHSGLGCCFAVVLCVVLVVYFIPGAGGGVRALSSWKMGMLLGDGCVGFGAVRVTRFLLSVN